MSALLIATNAYSSDQALETQHGATIAPINKYIYIHIHIHIHIYIYIWRASREHVAAKRYSDERRSARSLHACSAKRLCSDER